MTREVSEVQQFAVGSHLLGLASFNGAGGRTPQPVGQGLLAHDWPDPEPPGPIQGGIFTAAQPCGSGDRNMAPHEEGKLPRTPSLLTLLH